MKTTKSCNKYPIRDMEAGDSHEVMLMGEPVDKVRQRVNGAIQHHKKGTDKKFKTATTPNGIMIWRLK